MGVVQADFNLVVAGGCILGYRNDVIVGDVFAYQTGTSREQSPFNILGDTVTLEPKPMRAANIENS